ncbi:TetR/AcrR family transcriptional regulator [Xanthobacter autotrophicus]|uniref:TetR/AcrR family transcriptional regulator n=1 Tax=Xanthobacter autotrophicus TaxID=280 RepID=UPI0024A6C4FB|nr:TetR/AcrR family transcriptional regulator [Xanthobacter autotrophicus]MDI4655973.1 TetR/AcrR family transcriptional regulator [Xanthobacter autotrophicus]
MTSSTAVPPLASPLPGKSRPSARPAPATRADHRTEQRQRILAAAVACFSRDGFHGASMQKICAEAGMSPGALYRYFPSKESLIAAIVEGERAERLAFFDTVSKAPSVLDALTDCTAAMMEEGCLATARLGPEVMAEAIRNADLRAAVEPHEEESRVQLRAALANAVEQGEVDPALDLDTVVVLLQIIGDGVLLHHQLHPQWKLAERLPAFAQLVKRMLAPDARTPAEAEA